MKTYSSIILILCSMLVIGCTNPKDEQPRDEALQISANTDSVICVPRLGGLTALELRWTAGTNHGTGSAILYTLEMDYEGNEFAGGIKKELGRTADRTLLLSHQQLADTLITYFPDMQDGERYSFEIRMRARVVMTGEEQISPIIPLSCLVHFSATTPLYLIGESMPNGWSINYATLMDWNAEEPTVNRWTGLMNEAQEGFKILTSLDDWVPCYVRNADDATKMVYRENDEDYPDYKWEIAKSGEYTITADTRTLTIAIECNYEEKYNHLYMLGEATPGGWSLDDKTELKHIDKGLYRYEGNLNTGEIKFPTEKNGDFDALMLFAPEENCAPSMNGTYDAHSGDPDNKWVIPTAGQWRITIDTNNETISFVQL